MKEKPFILPDGTEVYIPDMEGPCDPADDNSDYQRSRFYGMRLAFLAETRPEFAESVARAEDFLSDLYETDKAAQSMYESLCSDMEKKENVNEVLKARDPVMWVRKKNAIAYQAEEIVRKEVVYV